LVWQLATSLPYFETPAYRWVPWRAWPEFERRFETERARLDQALHA
jgi:hypothetical protein